MRAGLVVSSLVIATVAAAVAVALAQDQPQGQPGGEAGGYAGVVPGTGNLPPRAPSPGGNLLMTWPGFQQRPDGASRFFLQTTAAVQVEQLQEQGRFVLLLKNTGLHLRNNRRPLETRYFNTPVSKAGIERRGRDLAFVLELRGGVTPVVSQEVASNGYNFIYLEFPAGNFIPQELQIERTERPGLATPRDSGGTVIESNDAEGGTTEIRVY